MAGRLMVRLRRRDGDGKQITRRIWMVLAALMLADGECVTPEELARSLYERPVAMDNIRWRVRVLRAHGMGSIRTYRPEFGSRHLGYWLDALPTDEHLPEMLAVVPTVKRSRWWIERFLTPARRLSA